MGLKPEELPDGFDFLREGLIDSLGIMELLTDIENHFGHSIDFEELDAEEITILGPLATHIQRELYEARAPDFINDTRLEAMATTRVQIKGQSFMVWLANDARLTRKGLMRVEQSRLAPLEDGTERGMLFLFDQDQPLSFWMFETIIPLDLAYIDSHKTIVKTYTTAPLQTRLLYRSGQPVRYALEVSAGVFGRLGLRTGDQVEFIEPLPAASLKSAPVQMSHL
jgi:uncharacterized membrane protein (UPF0127 family)/acyl carrier protein